MSRPNVTVLEIGFFPLYKFTFPPDNIDLDNLNFEDPRVKELATLIGRFIYERRCANRVSFNLGELLDPAGLGEKVLIRLGLAKVVEFKMLFVLTGSRENSVLVMYELEGEGVLYGRQSKIIVLGPVYRLGRA